MKTAEYFSEDAWRDRFERINETRALFDLDPGVYGDGSRPRYPTHPTLSRTASITTTYLASMMVTAQGIPGLNVPCLACYRRWIEARDYSRSAPACTIAALACIYPDHHDIPPAVSSAFTRAALAIREQEPQ